MNIEEAKFEAEYWRQVLKDISTINDEVVEINEHIANLGVEMTTLAIMLVENEGAYDALSGYLDNIKRIQQSLGAMLPAITGIVEMADGRSKVLQKAADEQDD